MGDLREQFADFWSGLLKKGHKKEVKAVKGEVMIMDSNGAGAALPESDSPDLPRFEAAQHFDQAVAGRRGASGNDRGGADVHQLYG